MNQLTFLTFEMFTKSIHHQVLLTIRERFPFENNPLYGNLYMQLAIYQQWPHTINRRLLLLLIYQNHTLIFIKIAVQYFCRSNQCGGMMHDCCLCEYVCSHVNELGIVSSPLLFASYININI